MYALSPLRYPGGKSRVANFIKLLCLRNGLVGGHYAEPYAGGAGVALSLLFDEIANIIHINDIDEGLMAFWSAMLNDTAKFCERIASVPLTVEEWEQQRELQRSPNVNTFERGFATFYLNRTNRSGIIGSGGVIGGLEQTGQWKIDARFNREGLIDRIERIAKYRDRIRLSQLDAIEFLQSIGPAMPSTSLIYLDPPYFVKGQGLYPNYYEPSDHEELCAMVENLEVPWVVSYDNVKPIRSLYSAHHAICYDLRYTAHDKYEGREVMFFGPSITLPPVDNPAQVRKARYHKLESQMVAAYRQS